ncbi:MAG TPA: PIN domain-containing protein [Spirochaetota bacterium]|nr:PIN domain-containing protein [Spirochaetota bacterium]HPC42651.1 PIN domain-containing protein [Spirochaetota bacterium]HQF08429.1 PIN domain-containing protein [Spirochaetota bacterium]HQH99067.1 PIN domain-containing protein [Spirochaetota bacterium]HQJ72458.1 PIN domain-containing protein [Spirochaetota bacterium]
MNVLVDTPVWSLALRRNANLDNGYVRELTELIHELRVAIIGPIRQELLSGIPDHVKFIMLRDTLKSFEDIPIETEHYELAAELFNHCRKKGIQGSHVDFLICAVSIRNRLQIFTLDKDFEKYKKHIGIKLYKSRSK